MRQVAVGRGRGNLEPVKMSQLQCGQRVCMRMFFQDQGAIESMRSDPNMMYLTHYHPLFSDISASMDHQQQEAKQVEIHFLPNMCRLKVFTCARCVSGFAASA